MTVEELLEACQHMKARGYSDWRVVFVDGGGAAYLIDEVADGDLGEFTLKGEEWHG